LVSIFDSRHHHHEDLDRGDVDVLIVPQAFASAEHAIQVLLDETYVCIACAANQAVGRRLSLRQYLEAGHVGVTNRTVVGLPYDELHLAKAGHSRRIEVAVPSLLWIPEMVVGTARLSTIHRSLALDLKKRWPIKVLPCPVRIPPLREVIQWHRYQDDDPGICWLRSRLAAAVRSS
jgi:LysR family nod box-dependent transcriptional activator